MSSIYPQDLKEVMDKAVDLARDVHKSNLCPGSKLYETFWAEGKHVSVTLKVTSFEDWMKE